MLNPVNSGGGVKTKMIEALGLNTSVVATKTGAAGVNKTVCGNKLTITDDNNWKEFTEAVTKKEKTGSQIPGTFYKEYFWGNIITRIKDL